MMIKGSIVAIVSPMHEDGALDFDAYRRLIEWHIAEGTNAIVAVGTTGESPTVDPEEHGELISVAVETARGRVPVIAGTGGNSTAEAIELTRAREEGRRRRPRCRSCRTTTSRRRKACTGTSARSPSRSTCR